MKRREVEMLWKPGKIELLAPARDLRSARAAIDCGADAVYMGGPRFGARQAAGNSVADIAAVAEYARRFGVRVYVTLNTLLFDDELADAERIARQVVEAGADALIVQDMAYLEMELEGVELHASTQTFNASPEKAAFLADCGFSRVILERNLSLEEIRRIRAATDVELECFVHGAICVCYSGRCYMSRTMSPRSGNRGDCMQACRLPYDLLDAAGNVLMAGKHLLSVRDMDLSGRLGDLLDAGVTSFKIEGRLKDEAYVRNVVAWYRTRLDREIAARPGLVRASEGQSDPGFEPDLARTFSRGRTEYFFDGRRAGVSTPDTPKAVGGFVCRVARSGPGWFEPQGGEAFAPGDGICFMYGGRLAGTNVNGTEGGRVQLNMETAVRRRLPLSAATGRRGNRRRCWRCSVRSLSGRAIPCSMWRRCVLWTVWRECLSCGFPRRTLCDGRGWKRCCVTGRSAGPRDIRPGRLPDAVIRTVRPRLRRT